jgi:hypothetical protein
MNVKIEGLDKLQRELQDAERALSALDGTITSLKFNPDDPQSVRNAVRQMETAIDSKVARYRGNALVSQLVPKMKEQYRQKILELAKKGKR